MSIKSFVQNKYLIMFNNIKMLITLDTEEINKIDLSIYNEYITFHPNKQYFNLKAGSEHYKLLAYLSSIIKCEQVVDIGTFLGFSALALSYNENIKVVTYDIFDSIPENVTSTHNKANIKFMIAECIPDLDKLVDTDLILLDIGHDGESEVEIIKHLEKHNYSGILILDDICLNPEMKKVWSEIKQTKVDITKYGHWSGTGLVIFDDQKFQVDLE